MEVLAKKGATIFINISASPFYIGKEEIRYRIIKKHAQRHKIPFAFVNQIGGNDELIFDGRSMCCDRAGNPIEIFPSFKEYIRTIDLSHPGTPGLYVPQEKIESVYEALILGIRDYITKCGFSRAILGLSGGIDSAVSCCLVKEAIGSENVLGVSMPGPYSSRGSVDDSRKLAKNIGIKFYVIPISKIYSSYLESLKKHFKGRKIGTTEENIQARIRGNILMALSNKFGYLVLSTGNKSELAVGYCTLYGDMSGGLSVISDVPKTMVYELASYINRKSEVIPKEIMEKPPSAELKPDQKDQDTLPPYEVLDQILHYYVDEGCSMRDILKLNFDPEIVEWVIHSVDSNEYKRRQAPPGLKVTTKAFGMGRRMVIAAKYNV
jgi:NAD+ synthase (glutamine-hydrolysing)